MELTHKCVRNHRKPLGLTLNVSEITENLRISTWICSKPLVTSGFDPKSVRNHWKLQPLLVVLKGYYHMGSPRNTSITGTDINVVCSVIVCSILGGTQECLNGCSDMHNRQITIYWSQNITGIPCVPLKIERSMS